MSGNHNITTLNKKTKKGSIILLHQDNGLKDYVAGGFVVGYDKRKITLSFEDPLSNFFGRNIAVPHLNYINEKEMIYVRNGRIKNRAYKLDHFTSFDIFDINKIKEDVTENIDHNLERKTYPERFILIQYYINGEHMNVIGLCREIIHSYYVLSHEKHNKYAIGDWFGTNRSGYNKLIPHKTVYIDMQHKL